MSLVSAKVTVAIGATLPSYLPLSSGQVKNIMSTTGTGKTMLEVAPPASGVNSFSGRSYNLGSLASAFCIQGTPILNPYYGQFGAVVAHNLTGHRAHYGGNEVYIMPFASAQTGNLWKRMTNPYPDDIINVTNESEYATGSSTYTGPSFGEYIPDYYGKGWSGDHTRGHQVSLPGGTGGNGRVFYPKTASDLGADNGNSYGIRPHMLDCGVETGAPSYNSTNVWHTRGLSDGPPHAASGGCWYEPDTGLIGYLAGSPAGGATNTINFFNPNANDWTTAVNLTPLPGPDLSADGATDYIASRKLLIASANLFPNPPKLYLFDRTTSPTNWTTMSSWAVPTGVTLGLRIACYANVPRYCPVDGNFYVLVTQQANPDYGASTAPQFWRFAPPVDLRLPPSTLSNAAVMASSGGTWTNITSQLTGDALIRGGPGPALWNPYNSLCWHNAFTCFVWSGGPNNNVQLIRPPGV